MPTLAFFISPFCFTHNLAVSSPLRRASVPSHRVDIISKSCEQNNTNRNYSKSVLRIFNNYDKVSYFEDLVWNFMGIRNYRFDKNFKSLLLTDLTHNILIENQKQNPPSTALPRIYCLKPICGGDEDGAVVLTSVAARGRGEAADERWGEEEDRRVLLFLRPNFFCYLFFVKINT
jgi:hypothetical protein